MSYREITIENKEQKKIIALRVDETSNSSEIFLNCELQGSFNITKTGKTSKKFWTISSIREGQKHWEISGKDNDVIDFALFSNETGKNLFDIGRKSREFLTLKLGFLGLKEISIKNIRKTHNTQKPQSN